MPTTRSRERSRQTPTRASGPTPRSRKQCASRLARAIELPVGERLPPPATTAAASGVRRACSANSSCTQGCRPRALRVSFHSTRSCASSAPESSGSSDSRCRDRHGRPPAGLRSDRAGAPDGRTVEEVGAVLEPSPPAPTVSASCRVRSNFAVPLSARSDAARARQSEPLARRVLEREHHLEERRAGEVALAAAAPRPAARTARPDGRRRRAPSRAPARSSSREARGRPTGRPAAPGC